MTACGRCHGDGVICVRGYSTNPRSGVPVPDPQEDWEAVCPDCHGTGIAARWGEDTEARERPL